MSFSTSSQRFNSFLSNCLQIRKTEDKYYLELIDRVGDQEINLADKLVELNLAQKVVYKTPEENSSDDSDEIYNSDVD